MTMQPLLLDKEKMTIDDLVAVARSNHVKSTCPLPEKDRVAKTSALIERWVEGKTDHIRHHHRVRGPVQRHHFRRKTRSGFRKIFS
jgi:hypothetical protein